MTISLFLIFLFLQINVKKKFLIVFIIIFSLVASLFMWSPLKERIFEKTKESIYVNQEFKIFSKGHQQHYHSALLMFISNPIFGIGVNNFQKECKKEKYLNLGEFYCTTHPHNTYIQLLAETGIVGFIFIFFVFLYFSIFLFNQFKNLYLKNKKINLSKACYAICIFLNLFPFIPTGNFFNNWLSVIYFLPLGFFIKEYVK
jgi:O-antigen ligase